MRVKRVNQYVAEWARPDCIVLKNRGAIVGHILKSEKGWRVTPAEAHRKGQRKSYPTPSEAATRYFVPAAGQAVELIEYNDHDAPGKVTP
jgi:hypothetical protein